MLRGKVSLPIGDSFSIPFEAPAGGCMVRFTYDAVPKDGSRVEFVICGTQLRADSMLYYSGDGACNAEGTAEVPTGGQLCAARWEASQEMLSLLSGLVSKVDPLVLTYKIEVVSTDHMALTQRERLVELAQEPDHGPSDGGATRQLHALRVAVEALSVAAADGRGRTALHGAAAAGNVEAIAMLLQMKAPLDARSITGRTPLLEACARCQVKALVMLLAAGADPLVTDEWGRNALHLIASNSVGSGSEEGTDREQEAGKGPAEAFRALGECRRNLLNQQCGNIPGMEIDTLSETRPLAHAAASGCTHLVQLFLQTGVAADVSSGQGLLAAASHGRVACASLLLKSGSDPGRVHPIMGSALHVAAAGGHTELVRLLCRVLAQGAADAPSIDAAADAAAALLRTNAAWRTPLLCAAASGHGDCVEALVEAGAPLEQTDREGNSPLLGACSVGDPKSVAVLLQAGAQPRRRNALGRDALLCAAAGGHVPVLPLLLPACADRLAEAMVQAAAAGQAKAAVALVELCPLPPPKTWRLKASNGKDTSENDAPAHRACEQLLRALWDRCSEEHALYAQPPPTSHAVPMASGAASSSTSSTGGPTGAAIIAAQGDLSGPDGPPQAPRIEDADASDSSAMSPITPAGGAPDAQSLDLDDLSSIQEMIRMELEEDSE